MAPKKKPLKKPATKKQHHRKTGTQFIQTLQKILSSALMDQDDFIITYEINPDDEDRNDIHVLTGKLISPCMLGTLKNRVELQESEGSKRLTMEWE
jgi:hypothetical protein